MNCVMKVCRGVELNTTLVSMYYLRWYETNYSTLRTSPTLEIGQYYQLLQQAFSEIQAKGSSLALHYSIDLAKQLKSLGLTERNGLHT